METLRLLALDQGVDGSDGPKELEDRAILVQIELGEPPERITAEGKSAPEGKAFDRRRAERLDPCVGVSLRRFLRRRVQVLLQVHRSPHGAGDDLDDCHPRDPAAGSND